MLEEFASNPGIPAEYFYGLLGFRLLLTPHLAGLTQESLQAMVALAVENVGRALRGETLHHVVPELKKPLGWRE